MLKLGMKEICEYVKASEATVLIWIRESGFPARKVRGKGIWLSDTVAIDAWLIWFVQGGDLMQSGRPFLEQSPKRAKAAVDFKFGASILSKK